MSKPVWMGIGERFWEKAGDVYEWVLEGLNLAAYIGFNSELTDLEEED
jgi:hypothetical protein